MEIPSLSSSRCDSKELLKESVKSFFDQPKECKDFWDNTANMLIDSCEDAPSSTTLVTSPHCKACSAEIGSSNAAISNERASPTSLGKVNVPLPSIQSPLEV